MCGIAGIISESPRNLFDVGQRMIGRLEHRGPDDHGWMCSRGRVAVYGKDARHDKPIDAMLLHRRLSILDLSDAGRQPMSSPDGRYHIVFNGEIYNYVELRSELSALGHEFTTETDTEVLLAAYSQWGADALPRLIGMFAFAILDIDQQKLMIARDFFGIKPFFYARTADGFAFASEIKALLTIPSVESKINPSSAFWYLDCGLTDDSSQTMIQGIHRLPAAHFAVIDLRRPREIEPIEYWRIDADPQIDISFEDATERLRELFLESVRLHLRSDVSVGTALSGGIDSSSIVMAARHLESSNLDFHSFSFIADDPKVSEEKWVDIVGSASRAQVHKITIRPEELVRDLDSLIQSQDEPFCSTSVYAQYRVFRQVRETGVKVMLDGQGADELLAGYKSYMNIRLQTLLNNGRTGEAIAFFVKGMKARDMSGYSLLSNALTQRLPGRLKGAAERLQQLAVRLLCRRAPLPTRPWLNHEWFQQRNATELTGSSRFGNDLHGRLMDCVVRSSLPMLLRFEDRNSMSHGVESRVPFLTPQIVSFVFSLPEEYLLSRRGVGKHIFREAMRGITPNRILDRKDKIGFVTPELDWLNTLRPWVDRVLQSDAARSIPVFRHSEIVAECNDALSGKTTFNTRIWRWLNLIRWSEQLQVSY